MKPLSRVNTEWSSNLSYAVGLITTDGYLSKDGRHLAFTSKDKELIIIFRDILGLKNKIGIKTSGAGKKCSHIQFGDINFYRWLLEIGLSSKKSKTISELKIPKRYFFDFIRGCFDGDGTCYSYWDKRWKSSFMFYVGFTSGSLLFLEWIRRELNVLIKIRGHIKPGKGSWQLYYAKKESLVLYERMYYNKNLPMLKRKYQKLSSFILIDKNNKK
jgi:hypothetical protein